MGTTPAQEFTFIFDTGSPLTWVRSSQCRQSSCNGRLQFSGTSSSTYQNSGEAIEPIKYADGSTVQGTKASDTVAVGKLAVQNFTLIEATSLSSSIRYWDGVMGLSFPRSSSSNGTGAGGITGDTIFWEQLLQQGNIKAPVFAYFIDETNNNGQLIFGGVDAARYAGDPKWVPVTELPQIGPSYWQTPLTHLGVVGKDSVNLPGNIQAIFDTGTSVVFMPSTLATAINAQLGATHIPKNMFVRGQDVYGFDCESFTQLPNIQLDLGGHSFQVTRDEYVYSPEPGKCLSAFVGLSAMNEIGAVVIGNALLRRFYGIFDFGNKRIGLAVALRKPTESVLSSTNFTGVASPGAVTPINDSVRKNGWGYVKISGLDSGGGRAYGRVDANGGIVWTLVMVAFSSWICMSLKQV
ncbi:Vacuolar protease A [Quaeritorhiza haematococci]|nr:Vacuolar protease A [Quaeritorhiza haematococci]